MVSAAINIGQNFYGFSFKHGQHNIMMKKCYPSNIRISSLLVDLQDNCIAFGWDAEERYAHVNPYCLNIFYIFYYLISANIIYKFICFCNSIE